MESFLHVQLGAKSGGLLPTEVAPPADGSPYFPVSQRAASLAVLHLAVTIPLLAVGLILYVVRIWIRVRPVWRISWEDYAMTVGVAAAVVDISFMFPQIYTSPTLLTDDEKNRARKYAFLTITIWGIAMTLIKSSIALMLIRIQPLLLWWKIFLWTVIGIMTVYGVGNVVFILNQCRPLEATWNPAILATSGGSCLPVVGILVMSNIGSAINISSDVLLSLAPVMFLWKLKRPLGEKILVGVLMALGLFASIASIFKAIVVRDFGKPGIDSWALNTSLATWTAVEQLVAMIAASAPFLKPLLQPVSQRLGLSLSGTKPSGCRYANGGGYRRTEGQNDTNRHSRAINQEDKRISKTPIIDATVEEYHEGDESPLKDAEAGIPLEARCGQQSPGEPPVWLEMQSDRNVWSSQKAQLPAQTV